MFLEKNSFFAGYNILSLLGKGGMGEVYLAEDQLLKRKVALKVLHPQLTLDSQLVDRFKLEAQVQANLVHSNIVSLYNFVQHEDKYIMVMQYTPGITLKELIINNGPIPENRALKMLKQIIAGLSYAHSQGIIHRDIKPSNIMVDENDNVKMMDFGIAKIVGNAGMTKTGAKMGTLFYMSPEQVKAQKDIDHRTDIYSLGVTLFEMLSGRVPFDSDTDSDFEIMSKIVNGDLPDPRDYYPYIPEELVDIIIKMTVKNREERFNSLLDLDLDNKRSLQSQVIKGQNTQPEIKAEQVKLNASEKLDSLTSAGFWRRLAAFLIDVAIVVVFFNVTGAISRAYSTEGFLFQFSFVIFYFLLMECSRLQGTIGKLALKIKIADKQGNRITFGKSLISNIIWIFPIIMFVVFLVSSLMLILLIIEFIMIISTHGRQGLHDLISGCIVIKDIKK